jgi:selenocysteine-specific elongation factor
MDTLGGGIILDAHPKQRHRRFQMETIENLKARAEGKSTKALLAILQAAQPLELTKLIAQSNLLQEDAFSAIESLIQEGQLVAVGSGNNSLIFTYSYWQQLIDSILEMVGDYHRKFPLRLGIPKAEISSKIKLGVRFLDILQKLFSSGKLIEENTLVRLPSYQIRLTSAQQSKIESFLHQLNQNPFTPAVEITLEPDLLNLLSEKGLIVRTSAGVVFSASAFSEMTDRVLARIKATGKITLAEARDMFQTSRKYAQALLEYMDEKRLTKRLADDRVLGENS